MASSLLGQKSSLWEVFSSIPDRRGIHGRRYPLASLLIIALTAMLCGRKTQAGICRWAKGLTLEELRHIGIRENRTPCPATWCMFFQSLDAHALECCLGEWVRDGRDSHLGHIAVDGKCLRGSRDSNGKASYLLSAFSEELKGVIGTVSVKEEGSELYALLELFNYIPLEGTTLTGDAAFTRKCVAEKLVKGGGDYFLVVKGNHKALRDHIAFAFDKPPYEGFFNTMTDRAESYNMGHGRLEHRIMETLPVYRGYINWPKAEQICRITRVRETYNGELSRETVYAITSLPRKAANAEYLLDLCRAHWGIENRLHWVRDVTFAEDACRTRCRGSPQVLASLRNTVLTILRRTEFKPAEGLDYFSERRRRALSFLFAKSPERDTLKDIRAFQRNKGFACAKKPSYKRRRKKTALKDT